MPGVVPGMDSSRDFLPSGAYILIGETDDKQTHSMCTLLLNARKYLEGEKWSREKDKIQSLTFKVEWWGGDLKRGGGISECPQELTRAAVLGSYIPGRGRVALPVPWAAGWPRVCGQNEGGVCNQGNWGGAASEVRRLPGECADWKPKEKRKKEFLGGTVCNFLWHSSMRTSKKWP